MWAPCVSVTIMVTFVYLLQPTKTFTTMVESANKEATVESANKEAMVEPANIQATVEPANKEATVASANTEATLESASSAKSTASTAITASAVVGTCSPWILAAGDWGVQSVTSITPSGVGASQSGVITLWGLLPIGSGTSVGSAVAGTSGVRNFLTSSLPPAHLVAGDQIGIFTAISTARAVQGTLTYVGAS